jgi:hypothetical protein
VFHIVLPDRTMRTTLPWPADVGLGLANVRGVDARGRIYFVSDPWAAARQAGAGENYVVRGDSVPLLRWDRVTGRVEPIAMLRITSPDDSEERRVAIRSGGVPFAPRDDAIAAQDGHVTIARATPYQVDVVTPDGRWLPGTPLAHTPVRLTEADRQEFRQTRRGSRFVSTGTAGGAPDLSADPIWDEYKPPFPFGRGVLTALDGTTWVLRWGAHGDSMQTYDLIDASGTLVSRLQLAAGSRVVTFAGNGVWVAREDNDGPLWLSRHNVTTR